MTDRTTVQDAIREWERMKREEPERLLSPIRRQGNYEDMRTVNEANNALRSMDNRGVIPLCSVCGFVNGEAGWIRFDFPVGHPLFGRAWPCPSCNRRG